MYTNAPESLLVQSLNPLQSLQAWQNHACRTVHAWAVLFRAEPGRHFLLLRLTMQSDASHIHLTYDHKRNHQLFVFKWKVLRTAVTTMICCERKCQESHIDLSWQQSIKNTPNSCCSAVTNMQRLVSIACLSTVFEPLEEVFVELNQDFDNQLGVRAVCNF